MVRAPWVGLLCVWVMVGCAPDSRYRRTGEIPAARPLSWNGRTAKKGTLRLEGAASHTAIHRNYSPREGDTALHVPALTLDGVAVIALTGGLELGLRGSYASYAWTEPTATGTMPLPGHDPIFGYGPELRGTIWFDEERRFGLGLAGNVLFYSVPTALWEIAPGCSPATDTCADVLDGSPSYRLVREKRENEWVASVAIYPSYAFGPEGKYGHLFGGLSTHKGFQNNGFSDTAGGPLLESAGFVWSPGIGYGWQYEAFRIAGMLSFPITSSSSPVSYRVPTGFLSVGGDIRLWDGDE